MPVHEKWKLLYDGECETCRRFAEKVRRFDRTNSIETVSLQDHYIDDRSIPLEELLNDLHMVSSSGTVVRGGEAVAQIISLVPAARPFRWMVETSPGRRGSDLVYRILKRRHRCPHCKKGLPGR